MEITMLKWLIALVIWNGVTFLIMGLDKYKATHDKWRISENTLLVCAFVMGGVGSLLGSTVFHHKTRKWKFRILLPVAVVFNVIVIVMTWTYI